MRRGDVNIDGTKIRQMREERALTLADLGERSGLNIATISRLENGLRPARLSTVRKLAEALEVEPREIVNGKGR
jgi:transcriptional regulator with XRE-family HTH domain